MTEPSQSLASNSHTSLRNRSPGKSRPRITDALGNFSQLAPLLAQIAQMAAQGLKFATGKMRKLFIIGRSQRIRHKAAGVGSYVKF
ncbi:hypothetical protein [Argonema antarcticum]|uniref:hypothetical protein n=1 Tax=Argonema antarcticum TaxID=2942763 RepID=UPI00201243C4|nr:hypothetical protein [Argonema antarcticum]MCL1474807.1 hypothetical protein [Argonema antarcticum A004/B2]